ncbi:MAG TPA: hypothetical protein VMS96_13020 [Terriglobales bacterium]|nr:hypothetical protein [Terriglobales bacterium]
MRVAIAWIILLGLLPAALPAQQNEPPKKPRVYTNDDLEGLSGGISVVGEAAKPEKPAKPSKGKADPFTPPAPAAAPPKTKAPPTKDQCADWGWGVVVAEMLASKGVPFDAEYWVDKTFGNTRCLAKVPSAATMAAAIDGDYTLDDGTRITIKSSVGVPGATGVVDGIDKNRPFIVVWGGIPYLATGVRGVKEVYGDGSVSYIISQMTLTNPYLEKTATFVAEKDKASELEAVDFKVTRRQ